jgi:hypothetical protein
LQQFRKTRPRPLELFYRKKVLIVKVDVVIEK